MIVFVTGASSGFGAEIARKFVQEGHRVIAAARRLERLQALQQELGESLLPVKLDVSETQHIVSIVEKLPAEFAAVDVLVNNAGMALGLEPAHRADLKDWDDMIDVNVRGLVHMTRALLPGMVARGRGHIINLGSVAGTYPYPGGNVYGGTKAFVHQYSLNLRADLLGTPVRVSNVEPGMCSGTEFSQVRFKGDDSKAAQVYASTQSLTAADIAESVYWIANRPAHVNINNIELMPVCQAFAPFAVHRGAFDKA